jgi:hypothetical protein
MILHRIIAAAALYTATLSVHGADLVVVGHSSAAPMTKEQVSELFLGKSTSATPIDFDESSPLYAEFYKKATGRDLPQVKATWSRLIFTGRAQRPRQMADSGSVKKAIVADPKAVGYIEKSAVDSSVKVLLTLD